MFLPPGDQIVEIEVNLCTKGWPKRPCLEICYDGDHLELWDITHQLVEDLCEKLSEASDELYRQGAV